jgi:hypothetical protein
VTIPPNPSHTPVTYSFSVTALNVIGQSGPTTTSLVLQGAPDVVAYADGANAREVSAQVNGINGSSWNLTHVPGSVVASGTSVAVSDLHMGTPYVYYADGTNSAKLALSTMDPASGSWATPYDVCPTSGFSVAPNSAPTVDEHGGEPYVFFSNGSAPASNGYALAVAWYFGGWQCTNLTSTGYSVATNSSPTVDEHGGEPYVYFANGADPVTGGSAMAVVWYGSTWSSANLTTSGFAVAANTSPSVEEHGGEPYVFFANGAVSGVGGSSMAVEYYGTGWADLSLAASGYSVATGTSPAAQEHSGEPYVYFANGAASASGGSALALEWYAVSNWAQTTFASNGFSVATGTSPSLEANGYPDAFFANGAVALTGGVDLATEFYTSTWFQAGFATSVVNTSTSPSSS